jgi:hypothetical protein
MAHKLPSEAYQLADTYQLGTPVRRHISLGKKHFFKGYNYWLLCPLSL